MWFQDWSTTENLKRKRIFSCMKEAYGLKLRELLSSARQILRPLKKRMVKEFGLPRWLGGGGLFYSFSMVVLFVPLRKPKLSKRARKKYSWGASYWLEGHLGGFCRTLPKIWEKKKEKKKKTGLFWSSITMLFTKNKSFDFPVGSFFSTKTSCEKIQLIFEFFFQGQQW